MRAQVQIMRDGGYVTAQEAAEAIGAETVSTVHRKIKRGEIAGVKEGNLWYVSVHSLLTAYQNNAPIKQRIEALGVKPKAPETAAEP